MIDLYVKRFYDTYRSLLGTPQGLAAISKSLSKNTATFTTGADLAVPKSTPEFLDSCTGPKSRWDILGAVIIAIGFVALSLPSTDPFLAEILPKGMTAKDYAVSLLEVGDACLILCDELQTSSNLLSLLLHYKVTSTHLHTL